MSAGKSRKFRGTSLAASNASDSYILASGEKRPCKQIVMTACCYFKWTEARAIKDKTTPTVVQLLIRLLQ